MCYFQGFIICAFLGSLVKKSFLRGMVGEEDKLYEKFSSHEHGMCFLLISPSFSLGLFVWEFIYSVTQATSLLNYMKPYNQPDIEILLQLAFKLMTTSIVSVMCN